MKKGIGKYKNPNEIYHLKIMLCSADGSLRLLEAPLETKPSL